MYLINMIIVRLCGGPSSFGIALTGRSAQFETLVPFVTSCTAQTILSIRLLQHLEILSKVFTNFKQNFMQTQCSTRSFLYQVMSIRYTELIPVSVRVRGTHISSSPNTRLILLNRAVNAVQTQGRPCRTQHIAASSAFLPLTRNFTDWISNGVPRTTDSWMSLSPSRQIIGNFLSPAV
jgi:hypothetical protein